MGLDLPAHFDPQADKITASEVAVDAALCLAMLWRVFVMALIADAPDPPSRRSPTPDPQTTAPV